MSSRNSKCPRCGHTVGFAEKLSWGGMAWHQTCFRCTSCNNRIAQGREVDRQGEPYCQSCYHKEHGPRGFGYGGALAGNYGGPQKSPTPTPRTWAASSSSSRSLTFVPTPSEKCYRCDQAVYAAERLRWSGNVYHKMCFKCNSCSKTLARGTELDSGGRPYCKSCHGKNFGPKGYGYGMGAGVMQGVYGESERNMQAPEPEAEKQTTVVRRRSSKQSVPSRKSSKASKTNEAPKVPSRRSSESSRRRSSGGASRVSSRVSKSRRSSRRSSRASTHSSLSTRQGAKSEGGIDWSNFSWENISKLWSFEQFDSEAWLTWAKELVGLK